MKISYNWLKWYVPEIPEPNALADIFTYHICEVESVEKLADGDHVFDLGILPNRAHDLLSHHGVARELSGLLGIKYNDPSSMYKVPVSNPTNLKVEIQSESCRRYSARIIRNVKIGPSPEWVVKHLESIGQRSINNIVDATNIVMYDCGQPCHAFDLAKLASEKIVITNAKEGVELPVVGRDGIVAKLKDSDLVITDGEKNLALGGVKGGLDSGISDMTTDIVLEVANFDPIAVRKTARRLGLLSDSAKRFENDLSPSLCDFGMLELTGMILEILPDAIFEDVVDIYPNKQESRTLEFSKSYIEKLLGTEVPENDISNILMRYGYQYKEENGEYMIFVPLLRLDLVSKEDMAEEIGRIYGLDKIKPILPSIIVDLKKNEVYEKISQARGILVEAGYREVMTYTFVDKGDIEVLASASDKKFLRTNLTDGLKQSYELNKLNAPLLGIDEIKIFEIGTIFTKDGEEVHVGFANKKEVKDMTLDKFISSTSSEESSTQVLGSPSAQPDHLSNLSSDFVNDSFFKIWSAYPFITRDIAVWVPEEVKAETLSEIYKEFGTELLQGEPRLVDTFTKEGRTSYAFRLIFQSYDRTLTIEEVNLIMSHITEKLSSIGFEVR
jgi:phenylalanyl-tRNA synthetase beta chain